MTFKYFSLTSVSIPNVQSWCHISFNGTDSNPLSKSDCNLYVKNPDNSEEYIPLRNLASIDLSTGGKVTCIPGYTFKNCVSLTSLIIPTTVSSIGTEAFTGCSSLTTITYQGTKEQWNAIDKDSSWRNGSAITTVRCSDGGISL